MNSDHPFFDRDNIGLDELQHQKVVLREEGSTTRTAFQKALSANEIEIDPVLEIGSREGVWKAVEQGLGIGVVADFEFVPHPRLRVLEFDDASITTQYFLAHLSERKDSKIIRTFLDIALQVAESQSGLSPQ